MPVEKIKVPRFAASEGFSTTKERSELMARIRSRNSRPEVALRKTLWHFGFRYRCHAKHLPGKPDIAFLGWKIAIFIDGDFWHGHDWEAKKERIKSNRAFWWPKIERNIQRDAEVNAALDAAGWRVVRIWEHELEKEFGAVAVRLLRLLGEAAGHLDFWLTENQPAALK